MTTLKQYVRFSSLGLVVLLLAPALAVAQPQSSMTFGVKAGVNSSTLKSDQSDADLKQLLGLVGGIFVGQNISDSLALQVEGLFSQRGAKQTVGSFDETIRLTYFDVPVLLRFGSTTRDGAHFHAFTGPQASFNLRAEVKDESTGTTIDLKDEVKSFALGWTVGAGVESGSLGLDARYTLGLTNLDASSTDDKVKDRTFAVMLSYRLK